jgi:hypothetical protein
MYRGWLFMFNFMSNKLMSGKMAQTAVVIVGATAISLAGSQAAQAGQLYQGWNYSIDAFGDASGGSTFDIKGLAIKETSSDIFVSISGNLPLLGVANSNSTDHNVGWGDLFFDFGGGTFNQANGNLFAVNFAAGTDSNVPQLGLYGGVTAKSVGLQNNGYSTLANYYGAGWERTNTFGTDFATKESMYSYYAGSTTGADTVIKNVIDSGTRLGDISFLDAQAAAAEGLNFANFSATGQTQITFKFDRALLPSEAYIASLFLECANDGTALSGELTQSVPEPGAIAALSIFGLLAARLRRRSEGQSVG